MCVFVLGNDSLNTILLHWRRMSYLAGNVPLGICNEQNSKTKVAPAVISALVSYKYTSFISGDVFRCYTTTAGGPLAGVRVLDLTR